MDDTIIPARPIFLDRIPGDTAPRRARRNKTWRLTPAAKKQAQRDAKKRERIAARPVLYVAVKAGAETFHAIRKATGLDSSDIHSALRFYIHRSRAVTKVGSRYFVA